jgi:hypothetical protein
MPRRRNATLVTLPFGSQNNILIASRLDLFQKCFLQNSFMAAKASTKIFIM